MTKNEKKILIFNKKKYITSNIYIKIIKNILISEKICHLGTLDPSANGILLIYIGNNTRYLDIKKKKYITIGIFNLKTETLDIDSKINFYEKINITKINYKKSIKNIKKIIPPMYSSIKHNGLELYKYKKFKIKIKLKKKNMKIYKMKYIKNSYKTIILEINCKHGTYIRSILKYIGFKYSIQLCTFKIIRTSIQKFNIMKTLNLLDLINYKKI